MRRWRNGPDLRGAVRAVAAFAGYRDQAELHSAEDAFAVHQDVNVFFEGETMQTDYQLADTALRHWTSTVERASRFFEALTEDQLQKEVAPGKNRLIYLWGHLTAVHDLMLPLLGLGARLHPELDAVFIGTRDRTMPDSFTREALKKHWGEVNQALGIGFSALSPDQWLQRHQSVSEQDFALEPHRNRFAILLGRTSHLSYHLGQAMLTISK